jgi:hypothetical protein
MAKTPKAKKAKKATKKTAKPAAPTLPGKLPVSRPKNATRVNFDFTAGYLIQTEFRREGGVTYERRQIGQEQDGRVLRTEFLTKKKVDDVELHKDSRSVIWKAYYVVAKHATLTPIGYFADASTLEALEKDFQEVRDLAREFNELAYSLRSGLRVRAEIYPLDVGVDNEMVARRLAGLVRERLLDLRDTLSTGNLKAYKEAADRAKNLEKLATGIQRESIRFALEGASEGRRLLAKAIKDDKGKTPEEHGKALAEAKTFEAIEAAIDLFTEPEGYQAEARAAVEAEALSS